MIMWYDNFLSSWSYFWVRSWVLTISPSYQSCSSSSKPPWSTPQTVGHSSPPSVWLFLLCLCVSTSMRCMGGPGRQSTAGTPWISWAPCYSNHSGFPKAAVQQLLLLRPEMINTFNGKCVSLHLINGIGSCGNCCCIVYKMFTFLNDYSVCVIFFLRNTK